VAQVDQAPRDGFGLLTMAGGLLSVSKAAQGLREQTQALDAGVVRLRGLSYPYRAMLAICSDLDETPDGHVYGEIMRFLNTTEMTTLGPGVGLEVGNTIYFDMPAGQFSYWNTDDAGREMVRTLIRSGHIDCLHSYGDLATTRAHAGRALEELARHDCRLEVWIDHAVAPTNFGADIMRGHGDEPGHPAYHADLTCGYGVKYVWCGRLTSMIGQDAPPSLGGVFSARHPLSSARTVAKEAAKRLLARRGSEKYAMHGPNVPLRRVQLRDGRPVYEFMRCNPHWRGVQYGATADGLADVLTPAVLNRLIQRGGVAVFYTHLGKVRDRRELLPSRTRAALRYVAELYRSRQILVTTTARLLRYLTVRDSLAYRVERSADRQIIFVDSVTDAVAGFRQPSREDLDGIGFTLPNVGLAELRLPGDKPVACHTEMTDNTLTLAVPWHELRFPDLQLHATRSPLDAQTDSPCPVQS